MERSSSSRKLLQVSAIIYCLILVQYSLQPVAVLHGSETAERVLSASATSEGQEASEVTEVDILPKSISADESDELELAASEVATTITQTSYKIEASGWPSTSPMWPSVLRAEEESNVATIGNDSHRLNVVEPFIYADKPRTKDYSLFLALNETSLDTLRNNSKPMAVNLSFEYYFNFGSEVTALPAIKVEVNRNQIERLEPSDTIKARMWIKFNERISVTDPAQFNIHDWLKFSLINRMSPSLVAIRRLKVEFVMSTGSLLTAPLTETPVPPSSSIATSPTSTVQKATTADTQNTVQSNVSVQQQSSAAPVVPTHATLAPSYHNQYQQQQQQQTDFGYINKQSAPGTATTHTDDPNNSPSLPTSAIPVAQPESPSDESPFRPATEPAKNPYSTHRFGGGGASASEPVATYPSTSHVEDSPTLDNTKHAQSIPTTFSDGDDIDRASSAALESKIQPVTQKPSQSSGWGLGGLGKRRRRKREVNGDGVNEKTKSIVLTCFNRNQCDWKTDNGEEIQWSLARMPPSTDTVKSGYYYVSNLNNYGDSSKMLNIWLNRTDSATVGDQNSEHCIEVAIYVTERTYLKLYRLKRKRQSTGSNLVEWERDNLLLTWAPTTVLTGQQQQEMAGASATSPELGSKLRGALPNAKLAAMNAGQSGWTVETLCYGDFFVDSQKCGTSECAFGFRMESQQQDAQPNEAERELEQQQQGDSSSSSEIVVKNSEEQQQLATSGDQMPMTSQAANNKDIEQVVGISLLREFAINKQVKPHNTTWLQTWQRDEVMPNDNWHFYPNSDYHIGTNNVSLVNLYNDSHYSIESDWLKVDNDLEFKASLVIQRFNTSVLNETIVANFTRDELDRLQREQQQLEIVMQPAQQLPLPDDVYVFKLNIVNKLIDSNYNIIHTKNQAIDWPLMNITGSQFELELKVTELIREARQGQLARANGNNGDDDSWFKIILEFVLDCHWTSPDSTLSKFLIDNGLSYEISIANVTLSDRCYPNPCLNGAICKQNGTGPEEWECNCDADQKLKSHRGRRCEFGNWCKYPHVLPWAPSLQATSGSFLQLPAAAIQPRQAKLIIDGEQRVSGDEYCRKRLGEGFKCTDLEVELNSNPYTEEEKTFTCSCQDDYYFGDDLKCKRAHLCNSIVCPSIGMICDESKPFNQTQPCHCNERQDWFHDPSDPENKCMRRQCQNKIKDCQFDAHICLPTLPGEKPICKCGPRFKLGKNQTTGQLECQSTACVLPSLNDCEQICKPNNLDLQRPFTCDCHPGFKLAPNNRGCIRSQAKKTPPRCKDSGSQFCTEEGYKCRQGFQGEKEEIELLATNYTTSTATHQQQVKQIRYVKSIRCLNVCLLTSAERSPEFKEIDSICPLGLCDPVTFQCSCSDPNRESIIHTKYEPIFASSSLTPDGALIQTADKNMTRISPLCRLKRVCETNSKGYQTCRSKGAICVPDYQEPEMFDCVCPPSTEKKSTNGEFTCESKCSSKAQECLVREAVCKLIDKDQVRCDCLPGFMFDPHAKKCYLAKYSYSFNLVIVNKYYEPESKFHRLEMLNSTNEQPVANGGEETSQNGLPERNGSNNGDELVPFQEIAPQYLLVGNGTTALRSIFIADYNQCNIAQVIPKDIIDDPYEHDIGSFFSYIDQCNEKLHQNLRNYHLNSRLSEDLRQSLRQHLKDFTITTSNSSCIETDQSGAYLNCTVYLQSNEPIQESTVDFVFNDCVKNGRNNDFCWIKPRLLLQKPITPVHSVDFNETQPTSIVRNKLNFHQIIPCEINNFCDGGAHSFRNDNRTSLCSCKCPQDVKVAGARELEPRRHDDDESTISVKQICKPIDYCGTNSTFCHGKPGSVCLYHDNSGSRCDCKPPFYENADGACVEVIFNPINDMSKLIIILLSVALFISIAINLGVIAKPKKLFGQSGQYPLNEYPASRPANRSTGVPNHAFVND